MRILVVDDSEDSRELTEAALLSAGYHEIGVADSGRQALNMLDIGSTSEAAPGFDIILLDIVMPEMDGIETCARIRNDARYTDHPIVMVTSLDDMNSLGNAFVAGATDYITKPINRVELVARVRAALKLKTELDRRQAREQELLTFLSSWGDRRATLWIDESTGLFVGQVAEAYLIAAAQDATRDSISVIALTLDRFEAYRSAYGEKAAQIAFAQVAQALRGLPAEVGTIAASYKNGTMIIVDPGCDAEATAAMADTIRTTIANLRLPNPESINAEYWTATVVAVTGSIKDGLGGAKLLTKALFKVNSITATGGNRVLATTV